MMPFGWWLARIYYYAGLGLALAGALLAFSAHRKSGKDSGVWLPPNDSIVPAASEARGFKGRDIFGEPHASDSSDASQD
jgi:hypothetical protein